MIVMGLCVMRAGAGNEIAEIGAVLWDTELGEAFSPFAALVRPGAEAQPVEGEAVSHALRQRHGQPLDIRILQPLNRLFAEAGLVLTHGGLDRDRAALEAAYAGFGLKLPDARWADLAEDIEADPDTRASLARLARHHDIPLPLPLRAWPRALATAMLAARYPLDALLAAAEDPRLVVRAEVGYEDRDKAKAQGFLWQKAGGRDYPKAWVRTTRQGRIEALRQACDFDIAIIERL